MALAAALAWRAAIGVPSTCFLPHTSQRARNGARRAEVTEHIATRVYLPPCEVCGKKHVEGTPIAARHAKAAANAKAAA